MLRDVRVEDVTYGALVVVVVCCVDTNPTGSQPRQQTHFRIGATACSLRDSAAVSAAGSFFTATSLTSTQCISVRDSVSVERPRARFPSSLSGQAGRQHPVPVPRATARKAPFDGQQALELEPLGMLCVIQILPRFEGVYVEQQYSVRSVRYVNLRAPLRKYVRTSTRAPAACMHGGPGAGRGPRTHRIIIYHL